MANNPEQKSKNPDLGLGELVAQENRTRFVNPDGSFNVYRKGMWNRGAFSVYHAILNSSWPRFFAGVLLYYVLANLLFTLLYLLCGRSAFPEIASLDLTHRFKEIFFYSVQVISTLGSSPLHPYNTMAEVVLALESMVGLFGFAMATGLMFARFSNPAVKILFSDKAVIAPYLDITGFMVRVINGRSNELINVAAVMTMSIGGPDGKRQFYQLNLERDSVVTFPLNWTIVHPINEASPLYKRTIEDLYKQQAEFVVNITAVDPDLSKTVYSRRSYKDGEIVRGKFVNIIERDKDGTVTVDPARLSELE